MREILFRGFDEENKCWRVGWYTRLVEGARKFDAIVCDEDGTLTRYYIHDDKTIGQFTGLNDKNGNKIFEGDIIEYPPQRKKFIVEFYNDCFGARDKKDKRTRIGSGDDFIIIGNVYDNPELMTAPKEATDGE